MNQRKKKRKQTLKGSSKMARFAGLTKGRLAPFSKDSTPIAGDFKPMLQLPQSWRGGDIAVCRIVDIVSDEPVPLVRLSLLPKFQMGKKMMRMWMPPTLSRVLKLGEC
ncbi:hypothetical protein Bca4012_021866 [Brassica carinata]